MFEEQMTTVRKYMKRNNGNSFENPIIHREIKGEKVFVPLDLRRAWDR